eukprot:ANDGO_02094.mRNA.1 Meiotically up-regulated gene 105 protein
MGSELDCPLCHLSFEDSVVLSLHVNQVHFPEDAALSETSDLCTTTAAHVPYFQESGASCSSSYSLLPLLQTLHSSWSSSSSSHSHSQRTAFVRTPFVHYRSLRGEDQGWGCGFRNLQLLFSALLRSPILQHRLFEGLNAVPSIESIQVAVEQAWRAGFDRAGCEQLGGSLLGTRTWIGATEVYALLTYFGIDCTIVDFVNVATRPLAMMEYLWDHVLTDAQRNAFPIYFQHDGHSRTLIGVEKHLAASTASGAGEYKLLLADPGIGADEAYEAALREKGLRAMPSLRRRIRSISRKGQYQIVIVKERVLSDSEQQARKIVRSIRVDCVERGTLRRYDLSASQAPPY